MTDARNEIAEAIVFAAKHLGAGEASMSGWGTLERNNFETTKAIAMHGTYISEALQQVAESIEGLANAILATGSTQAPK